MNRGTDRDDRVGRPARHAWLLVPVLLCLAALLVALPAGPVPLSGDSPLDGIRPLEAPAEEPVHASEEVVVGVDPPGSSEALLGVPFTEAAAAPSGPKNAIVDPPRRTRRRPVGRGRHHSDRRCSPSRS